MRDAQALMTQAARAASEMIGGRRPQLLLVLKPDAEQASYFMIKRISDTELGLPSQCCIDKHVFKCNRQYAANVVLKINAKLGGVNLTLVEDLPKFEQPTMIFGGRDAPPAGENRSPQLLQVAAWIDTRGISNSHARSSREIIADLSS